MSVKYLGLYNYHDYYNYLINKETGAVVMTFHTFDGEDIHIVERFAKTIGLDFQLVNMEDFLENDDLDWHLEGDSETPFLNEVLKKLGLGGD